MFYLIDDKSERQKALASEAFKRGIYTNLICISTTQQLRELSEKIKQDAQGIFIHDSFFRNPKNYVEKRPADHIKQNLEKSCGEKGILYVSFSGDYSSRKIVDKKAFLPVEVFYRNLDFFLNDTSNNLKVIAFGKNFYEEEVNLLQHKIMLKTFHLNSNDIIPIDLMKRFIELEQLFMLTNNIDSYQQVIRQTKEGRLTKQNMVQTIKELTNSYV
jgi:hypothetical protein